MRDKTTDEWLEYYEKLEKKNYYAYQETGMSRYDNAWHRYSKIVDAFQAKLESEKQSGLDQKKRIANKNAVVDRLIRETYAKGEVISLLNDAVWW